MRAGQDALIIICWGTPHRSRRLENRVETCQYLFGSGSIQIPAHHQRESAGSIGRDAQRDFEGLFVFPTGFRDRQPDESRSKKGPREGLVIDP